MDGPRKRPWWRKKRYVAAAALMLIAAYPATLGPVYAAVCRGSVPYDIYETAAPAWHAAEMSDATDEAYTRYTEWWGEFAGREEAISLPSG